MDESGQRAANEPDRGPDRGPGHGPGPRPAPFGGARYAVRPPARTARAIRALFATPQPTLPPRVSAAAAMPSYRFELDKPNSIVMVMVTEDDGSEHDFQFDFEPKSGRWEFSERFLLERDYGEEFVDEMEADVQRTIDEAVGRNQGS